MIYTKKGVFPDPFSPYTDRHKRFEFLSIFGKNESEKSPYFGVFY